jgi:hypothetical protein
LVWSWGAGYHLVWSLLESVVGMLEVLGMSESVLLGASLGITLGVALEIVNDSKRNLKNASYD